MRRTVSHSLNVPAIPGYPNLARRLAAGDAFLREIMTKGKVLYEKDGGRGGEKGRGRLPVRRARSEIQRVPGPPLENSAWPAVSQRASIRARFFHFSLAYVLAFALNVYGPHQNLTPCVLPPRRSACGRVA
jgi:hypothetical protein